MIRRTTLLAAWSVLLLASAVFAQKAEEKVTLKHAFPPGEYTLTESSQAESTTEFEKQGMAPQKSQTSDSLTWNLNVGRPNEKGEKKVTLKLMRVVTENSADKSLAFDSDKPAEGQNAGLAFVYKPLIGLPVEIVLDTDDSVVQVSGLNKLWTELAEKATTAEQKDAVALIRMELGDKTIEEALRRMESVTPRNAVAAGDSWKAGIRVELPLIGEIKIRYDCKLQSIDSTPSGRLALIACKSVFESSNPQSAKLSGVDVTIAKLQAEENSTLKKDVTTGLTLSDEKKAALTINIKAKDEKGNDILATIRVNRTTSVTIKPQNAGTANATDAATKKPSLPDAVTKAFLAEFPKGEIAQVAEDGKNVYRITFKDNGVDQQAVIVSDGTNLGVIATVNIELVPEPYRKIIQEKAKDATIKRVERIEARAEVDDGKLIKFDKPSISFRAELAKGDLKAMVTVDDRNNVAFSADKNWNPRPQE